MSKLDKLNGVAHYIAHHVQSSLSVLFPNLGIACKGAGILTTKVELLNKYPYFEGLRRRISLTFAMRALRKTLDQILIKHGYPVNELSKAELEFTFLEDYADYSLFEVHSTLSAHGRKYECVLPILGDGKRKRRKSKL
jgi:hypothetical protein